MKMTSLLVAALGASALVTGVVGQTSAQIYEAIAQDHPIEFIGELASMPVPEQRAFLAIIGATMQERQGLACNIFGGESSCVNLPAESAFANVCHEHDLKVDCAYDKADLQEINEDPTAEARQVMKDAGQEALEAACPECWDNQRRLWCAQTVPKCGSFQSNVETAILPAIHKVLGAQERGRNQAQALGEALPALVKAMSLAWPCREMCEAVVSSCSCGQEMTLGDLLEGVSRGVRTIAGAAVPADLSMAMFGPLAHQPLCSLYANSSEPGFAGHCSVLPGTCSHRDTWCSNGANPGPKAVQQLMALQMAKSVFGWLTDDGGLLPEERSIIDDADDKDVQKWEDKYVQGGPPPPKHKSRAGAITGVVLLALACLALLVFAVWRRRQQRRTQGHDYAGLELEDEAAAEPLYQAPPSQDPQP